ncbi:hypothetical protein [Scytonema sp. PCC 10023]|uniref:hypothetical protein n=1 Tax=Scytonema sp. PCC 10023 TaxID=1680591 RepID=UPI0039C6665F
MFLEHSTLHELLYELRFQQNHLIAKSVILHLQQCGITLPDFLEGLGTFLDEKQYSQSAALIQQAHLTLQHTYHLKKESL